MSSRQMLPPSLPVGLDNARRFLTLDALRGVAALAVVQFHTSSFAGEKLVRHGYLAVDFFFLLSGFVLSFAYGDRLDRGWRKAEFLKVRAIRLYPLYALGLALGLTLRLADHLFGKPTLPVSALATLVAAGLLLVPVPVQFAGVSAFAFPLNVPAWSLFFEAVANVLHVLLLRCRSIMFLALTTAFGGVVFFTFAVRAGGMDLGSHRTELVPGVARVVMSYVGGCLLFRLWKRQSIRFAAPPWLVALLLLAMLVGPPVGRRGGFLYDAVVTLACFPVLLLASANAQPPVRYARMFQWLGVSSYAVYILHVPLAAAYFAVCARLVRGPGFATHALTETIIFLLLLMVTAMLVDRWYDTPVRGWLRLRLQTARGGGERSADFTARGA